MGCTYFYGRAEAPTSFGTPAYMDDNMKSHPHRARQEVRGKVRGRLIPLQVPSASSRVAR